jgi:hypothetical protein
MDISLVPVGSVAWAIPTLLPYLRVSEEWAHGRATVDDLIRFVLNGQMFLWVVHDENKVYGHVITEIKQYPQCKMLVIQYCAMETGTLEKINPKMQEIAERFAKDAGCAGIEFVGRPGWKQTAREYGYAVQSVTYQKFFEEVAS